ncbi:hypothetical protein E2562_012267 [Oryza meyeriana var. granulata]|uniref:Uncharacterized protein n=1 Tax=Oryza meyeriana var. granulata TaxID=110450 RepID=A0A6G1DH54_9ORYZ|nr:hypothetical protein E2562_012267 [Oryza meyeriana var. granulata]
MEQAPGEQRRAGGDSRRRDRASFCGGRRLAVGLSSGRGLGPNLTKQATRGLTNLLQRKMDQTNAGVNWSVRKLFSRGFILTGAGSLAIPGVEGVEMAP